MGDMDRKMKESITIRAFGPLKDIHIEDIKPLTVLIGESASGKSTLMKTVVLMRYIFKMINVRSYLKESNISKSPFRLHLKSLLHDGLESMLTPETVIIYSVAVNGHRYELSCIDGKLNSNIDIDHRDLVFFKESFIAESRSILPYWLSRRSSVKDSALGFFFQETLTDFSTATESIKEQDLGYLNLRMTVQNTGNKPRRYMIGSPHGEYPSVELRYASSGIQTSAPLMTIVRYFSKEFSFKEAFQRSILNYLYDQDLLTRFSPKLDLSDLEKYVHIHIEEPELSLDPEAQKALVKDLVRIAFYSRQPDRELGIMMATHSPYIANYINLLLHAGHTGKGGDVYPALDGDMVEVLRLSEGKAESLMAVDNETGEIIVNTYDLSESIENIYDEYDGMV